MKHMRGYFGIGIEGLSKPMNLGALQRTAHAFGAAFTFTVAAAPKIRVMHNADTSKSDLHVPWYLWNSREEMQLPKGCVLVGIELTDAAVDLPAFRHPIRAAFLLASGFEREDAPAAAALAVGMIAGLLLAHVGVGLRNTHQYYPRNYSVSSDVPE